MENLRKLFAAVIMVVMVFTLSTSAFALDVPELPSQIFPLPEGVSDPIVEDNGIMSRAISGTGTDFGNQGIIYVYSPGYSMSAHATVRVDCSKSPVYVKLTDPRGRLINPKLTSSNNFVAIGGNASTYFNFSYAPVGQYKLVYMTEDGLPAKITFSLHDWFA